MKQVKLIHPTSEQLALFGQGRLKPGAQAEVERHIANCEACCQALRKVPDDTLLERLREGTTPVSAAGLPAARLNISVPKELAEHSRYRILQVLGAGGMGVVYQAEHRLMERTVALKVINRALLSHPEALDRFRVEVKAAARLTHPNIVTAFDADQAGDLHFLVMEYVEGKSLGKLVEQKGPFPVPHACYYIRQAALGLQHAFEQGMVHRDIKPQNLMLTRKGQVKILDFGLARFAREREPQLPDAPPPPSTTGLTAVGSVLGTPDYIAPEQAKDSRRADIRADIYSLGCTLYYLLAGRVPFPEGSGMDKLFAHVEQTAPPLATIRPEVPLPLSKVVEQMMAKEPGERFWTPAEVAEALLPFARPATAAKGEAGAPPPAGGRGGVRLAAAAGGSATRSLPPGGPMRLVLLAAVILVALGAALYWIAHRGVPGLAQDTRPQPDTGATARPPVMGPTAQILVLLPQKDFSSLEYDAYVRALKKDALTFAVASSAKTPAKPSGGGAPITPDLTIEEARASDYVALLVVGVDRARPSEFQNDSGPGRALAQLVWEMNKHKKPVAAFADGPAVLGEAGILRGMLATGSDNARAVVEAGGGKWNGTPFWGAYGPILMARDESSIPLFMSAIQKALRKS